MHQAGHCSPPLSKPQEDGYPLNSLLERLPEGKAEAPGRVRAQGWRVLTRDEWNRERD